MTIHKQYSRTTDLEIQDTLRWKRQFKVGGDLGDVGPPEPKPPRTVRWAKTSPYAKCPDYPNSGNVLPIIFGKYTFDDTQCYNQTPTFTPYAPDDGRLAYFPTGYVPRDRIVRATLHDNMWWVHERTGFLHMKTRSGGIGGAVSLQPGSAACDLWEMVSGTLTEVQDSGGSPIQLTVYNKSATAIPELIHIKAHHDDLGNLFIIWQDCP